MVPLVPLAADGRHQSVAVKQQVLHGIPTIFDAILVLYFKNPAHQGGNKPRSQSGRALPFDGHLTFETVMGLVARVHHRGDEFHMSKVVQLRAAIAPRGFVLPKHLNLMSSDAGNRARSAGRIIVFTDPDDAVTQR